MLPRSDNLMARLSAVGLPRPQADRLQDAAVRAGLRHPLVLADTPGALPPSPLPDVVFVATPRDAGHDPAAAILERFPAAAVIALGEPEPHVPLASLMACGVALVLSDAELAAADLPWLIQRALARRDLDARRKMIERELRTALADARERTRELEHRVSKLESEAWTDPLTGLANRRQLADRLHQMFAEAIRYDTDLACLMIDLDGFKDINDTAGHAIGDELLHLLGELIAQRIRASDFAARYGGDEFVVLMPRTSLDIAATVAQRIREAFISQIDAWRSRGVACDMSVGVASLLASQPIDGDTLMQHADRALYRAKNAGKGRVLTWTSASERAAG